MQNVQHVILVQVIAGAITASWPHVRLNLVQDCEAFGLVVSELGSRSTAMMSTRAFGLLCVVMAGAVSAGEMKERVVKLESDHQKVVYRFDD